MKKILAIILILFTLPALASCKKSKYEPVPSTDEEARVIMTLKFEDKVYEVKYELYRALFLNFKKEVSKGDDTVWTGEGSDEYIDEINSLINERITHIYSIFALCDKLGIDLYSSEVDDEIEDYIDRGVTGDGSFEGYGSYDAYLEALKGINLNYSAHDLMLRYEIGLDKIEEHYLGEFDAEAIADVIKFADRGYTRDDVLNYYNSDECVRVMCARFNPEGYADYQKRAEQITAKMLEAVPNGDYAVALAIINQSAVNINTDEVENGYMIGRHTLDRLYYGKLIDAAFALKDSEISLPVDIQDDEERLIYIVYRASKSEEHFENNYSEIVSAFLLDAMGNIISGVDTALAASLTYSDGYNEINHSEIEIK